MRFFSFLLFVLLTTSAFAQDNWELQKDKDNIKVYTKTKKGYSLKASKAISVFETSVSKLVAVLMDAENYSKLIPTTKESKLLKAINEHEVIYYITTDAPWPVSDRDGIYTMNFSQDPTTKVVRVEVGCLPDYIPKKDGYIRVPASEGFWQFKPLSNGNVEVTYQNVADPGGSIPAWLANSSVVSIPFDALVNLKKRAAMDQYQGQTFSFLTN